MIMLCAHNLYNGMTKKSQCVDFMLIIERFTEIISDVACVAALYHT